MLVFYPSDIYLDKNKVIRFLGYKQGNEPNKRIINIIDTEVEHARSLIEPKGIYEILDARKIKEKRFEDADKIALAVVTIGNKLEKEVQDMFRQGENTRALVLDAVGSVATEETANIINRKINKKSEKEGYKTTRRFSPGYGNWKMGGQTLIFKNIKDIEKKLGVVLLSSKIMEPIKSTSFVIKIGRNTMKEMTTDQCKNCHLKEDCLRDRNTPLCSVAM
ncbi:MAG: hypothetical protein D5R97_08225 [Candidatus Syntrophonatronum acetioxidans]|uniref:Methionine synthase n=1 Tax=Candidatus Syntrophonatronum acetioxidans TaxID=1795816 RepID=A0A424YBA7_9FIRM|nr:MAG: hypothetical protein D5R97_08225 [Candidatus Syntrophonatronum acetioxidans]